ncbi:unnamed protein product [Parajaminaea phylloscopi]
MRSGVAVEGRPEQRLDCNARKPEGGTFPFIPGESCVTVSMFSIPSLGFFSSPSVASVNFKTDTVNGLARLYTEHVPSSDHRYYASILCHFQSASHLFDTFSIKDARAVRDHQPDNFKTLIDLLIAHLQSLKADESFAVPEHAPQGLGALGQWMAAPLSPLASAFGVGGDPRSSIKAPRDRQKEALNCARLLTRLLPVLMESGGTSTPRPGSTFCSPLEENILWSPRAPVVALTPAYQRQEMAAQDGNASFPDREGLGDTTEDQFVIEDEDAEDDESSLASPRKQRKDPLTTPDEAQLQPEASQQTKSSVHQPAAEQIISLCIDYLFFPGFTLPALATDEDQLGPDGSRVHYAIWEQGIGASIGLEGVTRQHISNRIDFVRLLLAVFSKSAYVPPARQMSFQDRALEYACTALSRTVTLPLLCSLLNTACKASHAGAWNVPLVGSSHNEAEAGVEALRALCLQLIVVLLEWETKETIPPAPPATGSSPEASSSSRPQNIRSISTISTSSTVAPSSPGTNQFGYWLSKLHRAADLDLLSSSLFTLLRPANSALMSLPIPRSSALGTTSSSHGVYLHSGEAMTLMWRLLRSNSKFRQFVLDDSVRAPVLLATLLGHAVLGKDSPTSHGLVRLALFILQDVSAQPAFVGQICKIGSTNKCKLPPKLSALSNGASSCADVLISASYTLLTTRGMGSSGLGIYPVILITLANSSSQMKALSIPSATRLGLLLSQFSNPSFLLADEGHPRCLYFLLETINGVLAHQVQSNHNLVYAVLGKDREVSRLRRFTLRRALAEIRRKSGLGAGAAAAPLPARSASQTSSVSLSSPGDALTTPQSETAPDPASHTTFTDTSTTDVPPLPSEKALGKARQYSSDQIDKPAPAADTTATPTPGEDEDEWVSQLDDGELYAAAAQVGRNGFVAMDDWVSSWAPNLPLGPLVTLHTGLLPEMEVLCSSEAVANRSDANQRLMAWLREKDLAVLLNATTSAMGGTAAGGGTDDAAAQGTVRPFRWTEQVSIWLLSYIWGAIYVAHLPYALWPPEAMKLFYLVVQPTTQQKTVPAVERQSGASSSLNPVEMVTSAFGAFGFGAASASNSPTQQGSSRTDREQPTKGPGPGPPEASSEQAQTQRSDATASERQHGVSV